LFGFGKVARVTEDVSVLLDDLLTPVVPDYMQVSRVWIDPYVLGYLAGFINMQAKARGGASMSGERLGKLLLEMYHRISPGAGASLLRLGNSYLQERNSSYLAGLDAGSKSVQLLLAPQTVESGVDVDKARAVATEVAHANLEFDRPVGAGELSAAFTELYFYRYLRDKYMGQDK